MSSRSSISAHAVTSTASCPANRLPHGHSSCRFPVALTGNALCPARSARQPLVPARELDGFPIWLDYGDQSVGSGGLQAAPTVVRRRRRCRPCGCGVRKPTAIISRPIRLRGRRHVATSPTTRNEARVACFARVSGTSAGPHSFPYPHTRETYAANATSAARPSRTSHRGDGGSAQVRRLRRRPDLGDRGRRLEDDRAARLACRRERPRPGCRKGCLPMHALVLSPT